MTISATGHGTMDMGADLKKVAERSWIVGLGGDLGGKRSLSSTNLEKEIPEWLLKLIKKEKAGPPANPPIRVVRYTYRYQIVYYIPPRCCDVPSLLYDQNGKLMCNPDGGRTGKGDGRCVDFFNERKDEKVIWKDMRRVRLKK